MYKDKIYKHTDGVAMGSPLGLSSANFFLGFLEKRDIDKSVYAPSFYNRYIDNICAIFTNNDRNNYSLTLSTVYILISNLRLNMLMTLFPF